jgi:hypothetical protein
MRRICLGLGRVKRRICCFDGRASVGQWAVGSGFAFGLETGREAIDVLLQSGDRLCLRSHGTRHAGMLMLEWGLGEG